METYPTWIRLHPRSIDDTLARSVQARIHDPLWLLGRQWQFGELRHDGGATPIDVRVEGTSSPLKRLRGGAASVTGTSAAIKPTGTPLEALVEREAVQEAGLENLRLRTESGLHLLRMLKAGGIPENRVTFWVGESPFVRPADASLDDDAREWWELVEGRVPDGGQLAAAIRARLAPGGSTAPIDAAEETVLRAWMSWARSRFETPAGRPSTWDPEHMEYAFTVAGVGATGEALLTAPEYVEGRLDWYDFEQAAGTLGATGQATPRRSFRVPAPLDFAGMPNPRFWTFEDHAVQFDLLDVLSNPEIEPSPATLMVLDFAMSYSDDWFLVPIALDSWSLFDTTAVAVTDGFGDVTLAGHPEGRWNLFRLDVASDPSGLSHLFLAAGPAESVQGPPLEEVHLLPDEVANVGWAVERLIPHPVAHSSAPPGIEPPSAPTPPGLVWTLTPPSPPGNWFPLLPADIGRLALGALWTARNQRPAGRLLAELRAARRLLNQGEVPPEGAQVVRRWQSARAIDGTLHFWIGRSKTPRRTDIAPAIRFDVVEWK
jgi:hypothetical protein